MGGEATAGRGLGKLPGDVAAVAAMRDRILLTCRIIIDKWRSSPLLEFIAASNTINGREPRLSLNKALTGDEPRLSSPWRTEPTMTIWSPIQHDARSLGACCVHLLSIQRASFRLLLLFESDVFSTRNAL